MGSNIVEYIKGYKFENLAWESQIRKNNTLVSVGMSKQNAVRCLAYIQEIENEKNKGAFRIVTRDNETFKIEVSIRKLDIKAIQEKIKIACRFLNDLHCGSPYEESWDVIDDYSLACEYVEHRLQCSTEEKIERFSFAFITRRVNGFIMKISDDICKRLQNSVTLEITYRVNDIYKYIFRVADNKVIHDFYVLSEKLKKLAQSRAIFMQFATIAFFKSKGLANDTIKQLQGYLSPTDEISLMVLNKKNRNDARELQNEFINKLKI